MIDELFLQILLRHNLPPFRYYEVKVFHNDNILTYYWFHFIFDMWNNIDLKYSQISIVNRSSKKEEEVHSFISLDNLSIIKQRLNHERGMYLKEVVFKKSVTSLDLIELTNFFYIPLVSEKLKESLEKEGMNGFKTKKFDKVSFID